METNVARRPVGPIAVEPPHAHRGHRRAGRRAAPASGPLSAAEPAVARVPPAPPGAPSAWAPLQRPAFRAVWLAQIVANTGTWAAVVGSQWLMGDLGGGAFEVALVQTATTLPVFLLVVPSGALGDILDRRRLLLASHGLMLLAAALMALVTALDQMSPSVLLGLTAMLGVGAAMAMPTFSAIQPELVPRDELPQAALLNGANLNVARAVGPALGGVLISAVGPEATFAFNALSFAAVLFVLERWERTSEDRPLGAEHIRGAIAAGVRYVRSAPAFGTVLARSMLFIVFGSSVWALLPVVARGPLELDAGGYGLLLGAIGVGAVVGAFVVPVIRGRLQSNAVLGLGTVLYAVATLAVGLSRSLAIIFPALAVAGLAWIAAMSSLGAASQVLLPNWTRARGLSFFVLTFMGGQAIGSVVWGLIASELSLEAAFAISAAGLLIGPLAGVRRLTLHGAGDVRSARHWPEPNVTLEFHPDVGPVLVAVDWRVKPDCTAEFVRAMKHVGRSRRRTGATLWGLFQDTEEPEVFVETFTVDSWREHLRQHIERQTVGDEELEARARAFLAPGAEPKIRHLIWAYRPGV